MSAAAPPYAEPRTVQQTLAIAGLTRLSSCDWPGRLVATVFLQGCPWRCTYCHNPALLDPAAPTSLRWSDVRDLLLKRQGLLDGLVFSGGEPTRQEGLVAAAQEVRELGFGVGLHTAGAYPRRLSEVLHFVDWVGLDIKALPTGYTAITGVAASAVKAHESLRLVLDSGVEHEVRITVDPTVHTAHDIRTLVRRLQESGVRRMVLQQARAEGTRPGHARALGARRLRDVFDRLPDGVQIRLPE